MEGHREIMSKKSLDPSQLNAFTKYVQQSSTAISSKSSQSHDVVDPNSSSASEIVSKRKSASSQHAPANPSETRIIEETDRSHFDLTAVRREFAGCQTAKEKAELRSRLQQDVVKQLEELTEKEGSNKVANEIADTVDFVKVLYSAHPILDDIGDISDKSREAVIKFQEGLRLLEKAQDLLRKAIIRKNSSEGNMQ